MFDYAKFESENGKARGGDVCKAALSKWQPTVKAKEVKGAGATIDIYTEIGENWAGTGVTASKVASVLSELDGDSVTVNLNSPGGSFFDGLAIYNMLREYDGSVNVRVVGIAASAASVIAMAGDDIQVAESGFLMIHNAWSVAVGNKGDMREAAAVLEKFDESMVGLYARKTGLPAAEVRALMDGETWLSGAEAFDSGFVDSFLDSDSVLEEDDEDKMNASLRKIDTALAKDGVSRTDRRALIKEFTHKPSAVEDNPMPSASGDSNEALLKILDILNIKK